MIITFQPSLPNAGTGLVPVPVKRQQLVEHEYIPRTGPVTLSYHKAHEST